MCGACDNDPSNDCELDCSGSWGGEALVDDCGVCDATYETQPEFPYGDCDCFGDLDGNAELDGCDNCVGGNTGLDPCLNDCHGILGGDAVSDNCGTCDSDNSNDCEQDCAGTWGGDLVDDECGICNGDNSSCTDCAGIPNGDSWESDCGCVAVDNSGDDCDDCFGTPNGTAWDSDCGCVPADNDGDDCDDCAGVPNGDNVEDNCGTCDADNSNDCVQDCTGEWGGAYAIDTCGICDNYISSNGEQPSFPYGNCDCNGTSEGGAFLDGCSVCSDGTTSHDANSDMDCAGECFGSSILDCAGVCGGSAYKDCANHCCEYGLSGCSALTGGCYEYTNTNGETTLQPASTRDACGICDVKYVDVYPRLDDCDDATCSGTATYYWESWSFINGSWNPYVFTEERSCSDLKVLQDIIDENIENGNFDNYSSILDDAGNNNGVIETFELAAWSSESSFAQEWNEEGRLTEIMLTMYIELPNTFGNLTELKGLTLMDNQLSSLPQSMENLVKLKTLIITNNQLDDIKDFDFGSMADSLQVLKLSHNELSDLPLSIGDLVNLELLHLDNNLLSSLPSNLGNLNSLRELIINDNVLDSLPRTLGDMVNLKKLYSQNNQITTLPDNIGSLENLTDLRLQNNQLTSLPNDMFYSPNMRLLERLWLQNNDLSLLPDSIGNLINLQSLHLENNQLGEFGSFPDNTICEFFSVSGQPEIAFDIGNNLECPIYPPCIDIMLGYQKCTEYCASGYMIGTGGDEEDDGCLHISDWNTLQDIINENNIDYFIGKNVIDIVDEIHWTRDSGNPVTNRLIELEINYKEMTTIPSSIGDLDSLKSLILDNNNFTGNIPESLGRLSNLKILKLNNNNLGCYEYDSECSTSSWAPECCITHCGDTDECTGAIPDSIFKLEYLEEIYLNNNHLSNIPNSMSGLINIEILRLNNNRIFSELPEDIIHLDNLLTFKIEHNKFYGVITEQICELDLSYQTLTSYFSDNYFCCPYPDCITPGDQDPYGCGTGVDPCCGDGSCDIAINENNSSCPEDCDNVFGCTDMTACNYNPDVELDDGSCSHAELNYDCSGNCLVDIDECGICGGDGVVQACGCGVQGEFGIAEGECCIESDCSGPGDCDGNKLDCAGECGGPGVEVQCWDGSVVCDALDDCPNNPSGPNSCNAEVCLSIENIDTNAGTLEIYMINSVPVAGFQFELFGITLSGASGGTAAEYMDYVNANASNSIVLAVSWSGGTIPMGGDVLTQINFSEYDGGVCFGTNSSKNLISDAGGGALWTEWTSKCE